MAMANESLDDKKMLNLLSPDTLKAIELNGPKMDEEIAAKIRELNTKTVEGYSADQLVKATVNGAHQVIEITFDSKYTDWMNDKVKTCSLIAEAINDAIYKADLNLELQISMIRFSYVASLSDKQ